MWSEHMLTSIEFQYHESAKDSTGSCFSLFEFEKSTYAAQQQQAYVASDEEMEEISLRESYKTRMLRSRTEVEVTHSGQTS
jgi:hypothetical protein